MNHYKIQNLKVTQRWRLGEKQAPSLKFNWPHTCKSNCDWLLYKIVLYSDGGQL